MNYCYYHKDYENKEVQVGESLFCNEQERELWADRTYVPKGSHRKNKSVEEMQARLLEMGKETRDRGLEKENGGQRSLI